MNRPKKNFIPTTLSDLNIDSLSIGSNNDRQNNNSNGARLNNFDRFKATSSSNISYKHSNYNGNNNNNFSRTSKLYGSQSNLSTASSTGSRYQTVHSNSKSNYNINSPKTPTVSGDVDKWMQAWDDNSSNYRAPSYHSNAQAKAFDKFNNNNNLPSTVNNNNNFKRSDSNQFTNMRNTSFKTADPFDPFDDDAPFSDPWSGTLISSILLHHLNSVLLLHSLVCTNNFNFSFFSHPFYFSIIIMIMINMYKSVPSVLISRTLARSSSMCFRFNLLLSNGDGDVN